eukprot:1897990-Alexandrium_andersonii.AAC.1
MDRAGSPLRMLVGLLVAAPPESFWEGLSRAILMGLDPGACKAIPAPLDQRSGQHGPEVGIAQSVELALLPQPAQPANS